MTKEQKQIIFTAVLTVFLIFFILGNLKGAKKKAPPPKSANTLKETPVRAAPEEPPPHQEAASAKTSADISDKKALELQKEHSKLAWGRNPFSIPKASKEFQKTSLVLKGISLGKDKKAFAFINDEIVKKGDTVGNYEVVEIEKNKVLLQKDGQAFYITLPEE